MTIIAFHEVQFPPNISAGAKGGPSFNTTVLELSSGAEQRNVNWSREKPMYDVSTGMRDVADVIAYQNFFYARRGKAFGFRYKDWSDYRCPFWRTTAGDLTASAFPVLFTTDGSTGTFQLYKPYTDAGGTFLRKIVKPIANTFILFDANSPVSALSYGSDYTVDSTTGIATISNALKATAGHPLTGYFEFDVPVRFDTDVQTVTHDGNNVMVWDAVPIVGLKL